MPFYQRMIHPISKPYPVAELPLRLGNPFLGHAPFVAATYEGLWSRLSQSRHSGRRMIWSALGSYRPATQEQGSTVLPQPPTHPTSRSEFQSSQGSARIPFQPVQHNESPGKQLTSRSLPLKTKQ